VCRSFVLRARFLNVLYVAAPRRICVHDGVMCGGLHFSFYYSVCLGDVRGVQQDELSRVLSTSHSNYKNK